MKKGDKGNNVADLQIKLVHYSLGRNSMLIDGQFGDKTDLLVRQFQSDNGLVVDGDAGVRTMAKLNELTKEKFLVSVHGGHGGIDPKTGNYATDPKTGKRYFHAGLELHKGGWFWEGVENRIIANAVAEELRKLGIFTLVTHHPYECDNGKLGIHAKQTAPFINAGYAGYTHAFHSNAIGTTTKEKMDATVGGYVFTTTAHNFSDAIAKQLLTIWAENWGTWVRKTTEANFQVLRDVERLGSAKFGAILEEFGFFTSAKDALFITQDQTRLKRINSAVRLALEVKKTMQK